MMNIKDDYSSILKGFEREEIEELFSLKFCDHCEHALNSRLQSILNSKIQLFVWFLLFSLNIILVSN